MAVIDYSTLKSKLEGLPRYKSYGEESIKTPLIQNLAKECGKNHEFAEKLWFEDIIGAPYLAVRIAVPSDMTENDLERWIERLDSWGVCDAFCGHLVRYTPFAIDKAFEWCEKTDEFQKRAGFSTIAQLAWSKSKVKDEDFIRFLKKIEIHANDERYFVKKAVNWALRDIGKRNPELCYHALSLARKLKESENKTTKWVGAHRMKELT